MSTCCDMHNVHCEPPSELCCHDCTEAGHPEHPTGVRCVLDSVPEETTAPVTAEDLLARAERAEAVVAALPDPSTAEELREKITELLGSPDEALLHAFLDYAWSETARIAGWEMAARWQAEGEAERLRAELELAHKARATAEERLELSRQALLRDGYFERREEIGDDVAPRITERLSYARTAEAERNALKTAKEKIEIAFLITRYGMRRRDPNDHDRGAAQVMEIAEDVFAAALAAPDSPSPAPSPVSAATEATGGTTEAQEARE